ncbi:Hypothetical Protein FCC1311_027962 [Hondaea fermentalgiana]|uniref:Uncharacterized protein n=1 Tax=Hondaea fermentalgiana TaxID=2315210 RepID=A0A2R5G7Q7_9STRA|nr:Hypothetical Protein FCC1311_027962 [Hondaea fermentalgiana]|eukprot:GBG26575.1 Hypothetical Protein FCC1311_027962 [Hondaea fermentalgiana]
MEEVSMVDHFEAEEVGFGDVPVVEFLFRTNRRDVIKLDEVNAYQRFIGQFASSALYHVIARSSDTSPNGWTPFHIAYNLVSAGIGHQVDMVWTREVGIATERDKAGLLVTKFLLRARFLVHEHNSPGKFPYALTEDELVEIAQAWMQGTSASLDEAKEAVNHAWALVCDDLVDYWETGEKLSDRESSVRFRYPIIQIYASMLRSFCKYGVLSTTDRTWFFKLDHDNVLHVSNAFHSTGTGRGSPRYAYTCMLHRAATGLARLPLTDDHLKTICQTNTRFESPEWAEVLRRFGSGGSGGTR